MKLYFRYNKKPLPRYSVPDKELKKYVTTKADKKKNFYLIPPELFRIKDEPIHEIEEDNDVIEDDFSESGRSTTKTIYKRFVEDKEVALVDFKIIKKIGKGTFGTVYLVEMIENKKIYAMKQLRKDKIIESDSLVSTKLEKEILKMAYHTFLLVLDYV